MKCIAIRMFLAACFSIASLTQAQTYQQVYNFRSQLDGDDITSTLVRDSAGNLYGTSFSGGASYGTNCSFWGGCGTIFMITPSGKKVTLYNFGLTLNDGQQPYAGVIRSSSGELYGTTIYGGKYGYGIVFKVSPTGKEVILHTFTGQTDGAYPQGGLLMDAAGNLYGTAQYGGKLAYCSGKGCGTIFKITSSGKFSVLYSFTGGADGGNPLAAMISDSAGNLYGTGGAGGVGCNAGCGVVFELNTTGHEKVLHSFTGGSKDGQLPSGPVVRDTAGNLYGTTFYGGANSIGTVYKVDAKGNEVVLHSFAGSAGLDGQYPTGGLILDKIGNLYGTAGTGGSRSGAPGVVFKLSAGGKETILHNFAGAPNDGTEPDAALTSDGAGNLFGTTAVGGSGSCQIGCGIVFKLRP